MLTRWKRHIVTLLLLVYTSQSIAALLMPCPMDASTEADVGMPTAESMHHRMGHEMHGMAQDPAEMEPSMVQHHAMSTDAATSPAPPAGGHDNSDCCDAMGHCLMGSCMIHGANNDFVQTFDDAATKVVFSDHLKRPSHLTSVNFRPPIFA